MAENFSTTLQKQAFQYAQEGIEEGHGAVQAAIERALKREFEKAKKTLKKRGTDFAKRKVARKIAKRGAMRAVTGACASSLVFILITYLIWTGQAIIANWLGHDKIIPKLAWWELILWGLLSLLLVIVVVLVIGGLMGAFMFTNPVAAGLIFGKDLVKSIF